MESLSPTQQVWLDYLRENGWDEPKRMARSATTFLAIMALHRQDGLTANQLKSYIYGQLAEREFPLCPSRGKDPKKPELSALVSPFYSRTIDVYYTRDESHKPYTFHRITEPRVTYGQWVYPDAYWRKTHQEPKPTDVFRRTVTRFTWERAIQDAAFFTDDQKVLTQFMLDRVEGQPVPERTYETKPLYEQGTDDPRYIRDHEEWRIDHDR